MRMPPEKSSHIKKRSQTGKRGSLGTGTLLVMGFMTFILASGVAGQTTEAPRSVIERVEFLGNRRVRNDTLRARLFVRPGDPYNEDTLRRDFQSLWNTGFFEDVRLLVEDSAGGPGRKIVIFELKERRSEEHTSE